jgi:hypothetical protein
MATSARISDRALYLINLAIEHPDIIFSVFASFSPLSFVAGQCVVILLIDIGVTADGLEIVPP